MKSLITYFIKYPVAVNVMMIAVVIFGIGGIFNLKSSFFPLNESNIITISVAYPGASPEEMEEGVVLKIEDNLRGLVGIDRVTSKSAENSATITVETIEEFAKRVLIEWSAYVWLSEVRVSVKRDLQSAKSLFSSCYAAD